MIVLGIETSCDETAAAVVEDGEKILSNVVVSQIDIFAEYGGVIPEVAARSHLEVMLPVVDRALKDASCSWDDIDAIAVTHAPGLLGSLLIGTLTARTLAILHDKPLYAVHHLKSHVYANWLQSNTEGSLEPDFLRAGVALASRPEVIRASKGGRHRRSAPGTSVAFPGHPQKTSSKLPSFPILALVISGGHTQILRMRGHNQFEIVGTTRDDAVGECFDKVAKILGLPYPGGPSIAKAAKGILPENLQKPKSSSGKLKPGDPHRYKLPHPRIEGLDFSFSGLKTAVLRAVQKEVGVPISYPSHKLKDLLSPQQVCDFASAFQRTAIEILYEKIKLALGKYPETKSVVLAGGVSANQELKRLFTKKTKAEYGLSYGADSDYNMGSAPERATSAKQKTDASDQIEKLGLYFPIMNLAGDNGAMVAAACYYEIRSSVRQIDPYKLNIYPRIPIESHHQSTPYQVEYNCR